MTMNKQNITVDIIMLSYNTKNYTKKCLDTLKLYTDLSNVRVCVVDNNSTMDDSKEYLRTVDWIELYESGVNMGFSKGVNHFFNTSTADYVCLLNNDMEFVQPNWLWKMIEFAETDPRIGLVGPKLLYPDSRIQHAGGYVKEGFELGNNCGDHYGRFEPSWSNDKIRDDIQYLTGGCLLIKKKLKEKIGTLDEKWFFGVEDVQYSYDAKKAGFRIVYYPDVFVIHHESIGVKLDQAFNGGRGLSGEDYKNASK